MTHSRQSAARDPERTAQSLSRSTSPLATLPFELSISSLIRSLIQRCNSPKVRRLGPISHLTHSLTKPQSESTNAVITTTPQVESLGRHISTQQSRKAYSSLPLSLADIKKRQCFRCHNQESTQGHSSSCTMRVHTPEFIVRTLTPPNSKSHL